MILNIQKSNHYPPSYFVRQIKDEDYLYTSNVKIEKAEMLSWKVTDP